MANKNFMIGLSFLLIITLLSGCVNLANDDKINFEFNEGDRVGLIGHNGSGKSTLLRLLAGVYEPTDGFIEVKGLVTSMLNITMGTDPEATGIENINYRCRFLGMKKNKIVEVIEDVTEFAGLGDFLYLPIRTYSTGMSMRLAFAISTSVDADIILMEKYSGQEINLDDEEYVIVRADDIIAIIEK